MKTIFWLIIIGVAVYFYVKWNNKVQKKEQERIKNLSLEDRLKEKSIYYFINSSHTIHPMLGSTVYGEDKADKEYDDLIKEYFTDSLIDAIRTEAIEKLGLDESELTAITPFHFEEFYFDWEEIEQKFSIWIDMQRTEKFPKKYLVIKRDDNVLVGFGNDKKLRSSAYQVTWIFPTQKRLSVYQKIFFLHKKDTSEITRMFVWKHITSMTAGQNSIKSKDKVEKIDCFKIIVPGDEFICTMDTSDYTKRAIQAMKAVWTANVVE